VHTHDCFVVGTVVAGAEILEVRGKPHIVAVGDILQLHPHEPHANRSVGNDALCYRVFYLPEASIVAYLDEGDHLSFAGPVAADSQLGGRIAQLHRNLTDHATGRLEQESTLSALIAALAGPSRQVARRTGGDGRAIRHVRGFIEAHFAEDFGLARLAEVAGLSVFRVAHLFKAGTGLSPIAYRNQCRVYAARRLLLTDQPIADIAAELGFADQSHLTRQFQRIMGISPNRYRQQ
jgi:AraC-like DNA-binding protein